MKNKIKMLIALEGTDLLIMGAFVLTLLRLIEAILNAYYISCDLSLVKNIAAAFIIVGFVFFVYSFINAAKHIENNKDFSKSEKTKKILLLIFLNIYYLPIYYTYYVYTDKNRKWWGILDMALYIITTIIVIYYALAGTLLVNFIAPNSQKDFIAGGDKFSLILNENFTCLDGEDKDSYSFYCLNHLSEEEILVFNYPESTLSREDVLKFHIDQEKEINKNASMSERDNDNSTILEVNSGDAVSYEVIGFRDTGEKSFYIIVYTYKHENNFDKIISNITYKE